VNTPEETAERMRELAKLLDRTLNGSDDGSTVPKWGFGLLVFPLEQYAEDVDASYIGNYEREAAPIVLRRTADRLEANNERKKAAH